MAEASFPWEAYDAGLLGMKRNASSKIDRGYPPPPCNGVRDDPENLNLLYMLRLFSPRGYGVSLTPSKPVLS